MKEPLAGPLAAIASGILIARFVSFREMELLLGIGAFLLLGMLSIWRGSRLLAGACASLGLLCAGALTALAHAPGRAPELDAEAREIVILAGCVVEPPAVSDERERFILELEPGARGQVTLYMREGETLPSLRYGQQVEIEGRVRKVRNFGNPGAFDYARYMSRRDIYWTASAAASNVRVLSGRCGSRFQQAVMDLRQAALARIERLYRGDPYQTGMMQAILIGQSYQLQKVWTEQYRNTGTFHALVISGTHVAVLAAFFLFLLRICMVPQAAAATLTVVAAWLYALVTGWQPPCVRSAAGLTLVMIGGHFYRERRPINLLAAVALGFLMLDPEQLFDASFQLTFQAVAFLGAFAAPLIRATSGPLARALTGLGDTARDLHLPPRVAQFRVEMRLLAETLRRVAGLPQRVALAAVAVPARVLLFLFEIVVVSAVVQIGLALPMIVYFHRVGISGLTANAVVVPLMGAIVPLGFVAIVTGWTWVAGIAGWLLWLSQRVVAWHANLEPNWRIPTPPLWLAAALSAALIAAAVARGKWWRLGTGCTVGALLVVLFLSPFAPETEPGKLELTAIDVGQGESMLIVFPDGKRMLLDGGGIPAYGRPARAQLDIGEDVVAPYLWGRRFHNLDAMALSHAHEDHVGGLPALIAAFRPRELWTGVTPESPAWDAVRKAAARHGTRIVALLASEQFAFGGVQVEVLAPSDTYVPGSAPRNNDSLVLRLRFGRHSFLLTGDIDREVEWGLLEGLTRADVLKVAHHGGRTSTGEEFLDAVSPVFALVSAGFENSYGHPHREVIERLERRGTALLRTDRDGLSTVRSDGTRLQVESYGGAFGRFGPAPISPSAAASH